MWLLGRLVSKVSNLYTIRLATTLADVNLIDNMATSKMLNICATVNLRYLCNYCCVNIYVYVYSSS